MTCKRFLAMIATSTVVMYVLTYSTTYRWTHIWWSETRFWMALYLVRSQTTIDDVAWTKAMIPHHS